MLLRERHNARQQVGHGTIFAAREVGVVQADVILIILLTIEVRYIRDGGQWIGACVGHGGDQGGAVGVGVGFAVGFLAALLLEELRWYLEPLAQMEQGLYLLGSSESLYALIRRALFRPRQLWREWYLVPLYGAT